MEQLPWDNVRELDNRRGNGLNITLWWVKNTMQTFVTVEDAKGENFSFDVPSPDQAWNCFQHPMVYSPYEVGQRKLYAATEEDQ